MKINGKPVIDAKKDLTITITPSDCSLGGNKDPGACAAARAVLRETKAKQARVHIGRAYLEFEDHWVRYITPDYLRTEIIAFDRGGRFEPGTYELKKIPEGQRIGQRKKDSKRWKRGPHATKTKHPAKHVVHDVRQHGANR